jgi:hypothetical protein
MRQPGMGKDLTIAAQMLSDLFSSSNYSKGKKIKEYVHQGINNFNSA